MKSSLTYLVLFLFLGGLSAQTSERLSNTELIVFTKKYVNADKERVLGNYQEAFQLYAQCLQMDPKSDAVHYSIARMFLTQNNLEKAEEQFAVAHKLDDQNTWYLVQLIETQTALQHYKAADKSFKKLRELAPNNVEYAFNHANMLLYAGETKDAFKAFDEFERLSGPNLEIAIMKFQHLVGKEKFSDATSVIEEAIKTFPYEVRLYSQLADLYKAQGDRKKALEVYSTAIEIEPDNPYIQLSLADYYEQVRMLDSSSLYLKKAFENQGLDIDTKVAILLSKYPQAEKNSAVRAQMVDLCGRLVIAHPDEAKSHSVNGDFLYLDNQFEAARTSYYRTLELDQSKFVIWNQVLLLGSELNDSKAMADDSKKALELFPAQPSLYLFNGIANNQLKNYSEATKALRIGADLIIGQPLLSAQMLASLGDAYHELGRDQSSDSSYAASLQFDPNNLYVLNNYSYFLSLRNEKLSIAEEMSKKTVEKAPKNASYLDTYGWILFKLNRFEEAEDYLKKSLTNGGDSSSEVLEHYGDTLFKLGRKEEALNYWNKALLLDEGSARLKAKIDTKSLNE